MQASGTPVRLFCIPFAGGDAYSYRDLKDHLGGHVKVVALELPGRGRRFGERLLTSLEEMAGHLFTQIRHDVSEPYALYGHSMGGRLGYLLTRRILAAGLPAPLHLFASGCAAPSAAENRGRYQLPKEEFIDMLEDMDCPPQVLANEELMEVFEPVLRADFEANDTYDYKREPPFDIPVTVWLGTQEETTREEALRWQEETMQRLVLTEFPGGHFFIFDHLIELGGILSRTLLTATSTARTGPPVRH